MDFKGFEMAFFKFNRLSIDFDGQMGRWADGHIGKWADGHMSTWADGHPQDAWPGCQPRLQGA